MAAEIQSHMSYELLQFPKPVGESAQGMGNICWDRYLKSALLYKTSPSLLTHEHFRFVFWIRYQTHWFFPVIWMSQLRRLVLMVEPCYVVGGIPNCNTFFKDQVVVIYVLAYVLNVKDNSVLSEILLMWQSKWVYNITNSLLSPKCIEYSSGNEHMVTWWAQQCIYMVIQTVWRLVTLKQTHLFVVFGAPGLTNYGHYNSYHP